MQNPYLTQHLCCLQAPQFISLTLTHLLHRNCTASGLKTNRKVLINIYSCRYSQTRTFTHWPMLILNEIRLCNGVVYTWPTFSQTGFFVDGVDTVFFTLEMGSNVDTPMKNNVLNWITHSFFVDLDKHLISWSKFVFWAQYKWQRCILRW